MVSLLKRLVADQSGQDLAEYGIALSVIGLGAILAAQAIGVSVNSLWATASSALAPVAAN
jgi:Flp pilus assembly pilin Flp